MGFWRFFSLSLTVLRLVIVGRLVVALVREAGPLGLEGLRL